MVKFKIFLFTLLKVVVFLIKSLALPIFVGSVAIGCALLISSRGFVILLNCAWIVACISIIATTATLLIWKANQPMHLNGENLAKRFLSSSYIFSIGIVLSLIFAEILLFLSRFVGFGWGLAAMLVLWSFPPTGIFIRAALTNILIEFGDIYDVYFINNTHGIYYRLSEDGCAILWSRGDRAARRLNYGLNDTRMRIMEHYSHNDYIWLPYKTFSGGWMVPNIAVEDMLNLLSDLNHANLHVESHEIYAIGWLRPQPKEDQIFV